MGRRQEQRRAQQERKAAADAAHEVSAQDPSREAAGSTSLAVGAKGLESVRGGPAVGDSCADDESMAPQEGTCPVGGMNADGDPNIECDSEEDSNDDDLSDIDPDFVLATVEWCQ